MCIDLATMRCEDDVGPSQFLFTVSVTVNFKAFCSKHVRVFQSFVAIRFKYSSNFFFEKIIPIIHRFIALKFVCTYSFA